MNTDQLNYFAVLYSHCNFALAAKRIPMTPQGLVRAISRLEADLGVELFTVDEGGAPHPTPYADILDKYLRRWNRDWLSLQEQFNRIRAQAAHEIRLGASMGVLGVFGADFFSRLAELHPDITVSCKEFDDESVDKGLQSEFYDFAITLYPYNEQFVTTELFSTEIAFWVPQDSPLAQRSSLAIRDLEGQALAWPSRSYKIYDTLTRLCRENGVRLGRIYESEQMFVIFNFVQEGKGLGFTLSQIAEFPVFAQTDTVVCVPSSDIILRCGIAYRPSHALTPSERRFYEYCVDYARTSPRIQKSGQ